MTKSIRSYKASQIDVFLLSAINIGSSRIASTHYSQTTDQRTKQTIASLAYWSSLGFKSVTVVDSTGFDFNRNELVAQFPKVKFMTFDCQESVKIYGKGRGWLESIEYSLKLSPLSAYALYVPSRYIILNILEIVKDYNFDILTPLQDGLTYAFSQFNIFPRSFIEEYLLPQKMFVNESMGVHYEHILAKSIHLAMAYGSSWSMPSRLPYLQQESGTSGKKYYPTNLHYLFYCTAYSVKKKFFYWKR